jgi:hypothetical protein
VLFVCCLIVVPLPPGENPFAVNNNNKKNLYCLAVDETSLKIIISKLKRQ